jgi:hypothetical protein
MPTPTSAEARIAELHRLFIGEFERNANTSALHILKEIAVQADGLTCDVPTASPNGRLEYFTALYDRARQFGDLEFALKIMREMHREDCR